jgi:hypothetical protein
MKYIFLILFTFSVNSQEESKLIIHLDQNNEQISKQEYLNLSKLRATLVSTYKIDSLTYKIITLRNKFGQLSSKEFDQINQLISSRSSHSVNEKQYIIISIIDTLHNYESYVKNYIKSHPYNFHPSISKKKVISKYSGKMVTNSRILMLKKVDVEKSQSKDLAKRSKCIERIKKKFNAKTVHTINSNFSDLTLNDGLNRIDDSGILKRKFMPYITGNWVVIIKSDGEYLITKHYNSKLEKELLKNEDWSYFKERLYQITKKNLFFEQHGIFY